MTVSVNSISSGASGPSSSWIAAFGQLPAEARRNPAVEFDVSPRRDHVDLLRCVGHGGRHRDAEHRLDQRQQRGLELADVPDRLRRIRRVLPEPTQQRGGGFGYVVRRLALGQRCQHRCQLQQGIVSRPRQRRVSRGTARGDVEAELSLLRAAHAVATPAAVFEHLTATFVEQHVAADRVCMVLGQPVRSVVPARLLVAHEHQLELAARSPPLPGQCRGGDGFGSDLGLHVQRAAAPQKPVRHVARPGIVTPFRRIGEHRVDMAEEAKRRPMIRAVQRGHQVRAVLGGAQKLDREAGFLQILGEELDRGTLVARRVDGVEADQPLKDVGRFGLEVHRSPGH